MKSAGMQYKCGLGKAEQKFGDMVSAFSRLHILLKFGEILDSARRRKSKSKHCASGKVYHFYISVVTQSLWGAPSASASGISARATSA